MGAAFSRSGWLSEPVSNLPFEQGMFPREGGDPDWAPAFAGEQGIMCCRGCGLLLVRAAWPASVGEVDVHCPGREDRLRAVLDAEFAEDGGHVAFYRAFGDAEVEGDLLVQAAG